MQVVARCYVRAQCWRSGGRVRAVYTMFWQRARSQVSCDRVVLTDIDKTWWLQIGVMIKLDLWQLKESREFSEGQFKQFWAQ